MVKLSKIERGALEAWREIDVGDGIGFRAVALRSSTQPDHVRRAVRSLARKGCVSFRHALYSDDGMMGAGYVLTELGKEILDAEA